MSLSRPDAVYRPDDELPVGDGVTAGQSHGNDGARAHEGSQTGEEVLSILVCIEVTALLWTELQLSLLLQEGNIGHVKEL